MLIFGNFFYKLVLGEIFNPPHWVPREIWHGNEYHEDPGCSWNSLMQLARINYLNNCRNCIITCVIKFWLHGTPFQVKYPQENQQHGGKFTPSLLNLKKPEFPTKTLQISIPNRSINPQITKKKLRISQLPIIY